MHCYALITSLKTGPGEDTTVTSTHGGWGNWFMGKSAVFMFSVIKLGQITSDCGSCKAQTVSTEI